MLDVSILTLAEQVNWFLFFCFIVLLYLIFEAIYRICADKVIVIIFIFAVSLSQFRRPLTVTLPYKEHKFNFG